RCRSARPASCGPDLVRAPVGWEIRSPLGRRCPSSTGEPLPILHGRPRQGERMCPRATRPPAGGTGAVPEHYSEPSPSPGPRAGPAIRQEPEDSGGHEEAAVTFSIPHDSAVEPLVLALDVGSSGTRGGLFDATGRPLSGVRHKEPHVFTTVADGTVVVDPDQVVAEGVTVLETVLTAHRERSGTHAAPMAGVAIDPFASSLVGVDRSGTAVTPCFTYAVSRCAAQVDQLRREYDEAETQQRTGTRFHTSYLPARLRWLHQTRPDLVRTVDRWMSLSEYVHLRLLGSTAAGTSVAAWTGMLDRRTADWDPTMLEAAGVTAEQLSPVQHPGDPIPAPEAPREGLRKRTWRLLADAHWVPGLADGFVSNLGAGGADASSPVLSTATSGAMRVVADQVPDQVGTGLWCYRADAERSVVGGAINDVGRALDWLRSTVQLPPADALAAAMRAEPEPGTPLVLPFFTGERSTGWSGRARATVTGLTAAHDGTA